MAVTQLIALIRQARLAVTNSGGLKTPPTPQLLTIIIFFQILKKLQLKKNFN